MKKMLPLFALFCLVLSACGAPLYPVQYDSNGTIQGWGTLRTKNEIVVYGDLSATNEALRVDMEIADTEISNALVRTNDLIRVDMNAADENLAAGLIETNNLIRSDMGDALNSLNSALEGSAEHINETLIGVSNSLQAAIDLKQDAAPIKSAAFAEASEFATAAEGDLATTAVQPHTEGTLALSATTNITLSATNDVNITAVEGDINLTAIGSSSDLFLTTIDGVAMITALGNGGVSVRSVNNTVDITAYNGNVVIDGSNGVYLIAGGVEKAKFSATTNYFSVPITVGNATNAVQALNQTVADTLYADIAIEDLAANSVQPDTIGNLELTATGLAFIHGGTNNIGGVSLQDGQAILFSEFENPDPDFPIDQYSGVYVDSDGNIKLYWPYEVIPGAWGIKEHVFGALTNSFATPVGVGNAISENQALNRSVADTLYVQPHTDGDLELTATTNITLSAANEVNITAVEGDINLAAVGSASDLLLTTIDGLAMIAATGNGGVAVRSVNNAVDITAYNGNVVIDGSNGVYLIAGGVEKALFSPTTNYFSVPITVGNATHDSHALNQTVADALYADISITGTVASAVQDSAPQSYAIYITNEVVHIKSSDALTLRADSEYGSGTLSILASDGVTINGDTKNYHAVDQLLVGADGVYIDNPRTTTLSFTNDSLISREYADGRFATAAEGDLAITALQTNDVGSAAFASTNDFAPASISNDLGSVVVDVTQGYTAESIQAAINLAVSKGNNSVFVPAGTWQITNSIIVPSNLTITGAGSSTVLLRATNTLNNIMRNSESSVGGYDSNKNITISSLKFDGGEYSTEITLLGFIHTEGITVRNCEFTRGYSWHGVEVNSCRSVLIENCKFTAFAQIDEDEEMIQIDGSKAVGQWPWDSGTTIYDSTPCYYVTIRGCEFDGGSTGIGSHSEGVGMIHSKIYVTDCKFKDMDFHGIAFPNWRWVEISSCYFSDVDNAIYIESTDATGSLYKINIVNNVINTVEKTVNTSRAIQVVGQDRTTPTIGSVQISGNVIDGCESHAIGVDYCSDVIINGNKIIGCDRVGIYAYRSQRVLIDGNTVLSIGEDLTSTEGSITVGSSKSAVRMNTADIQVRNNTVPIIAIRDKVSRITISGNTITDEIRDDYAYTHYMHNFIDGVYWDLGIDIDLVDIADLATTALQTNSLGTAAFVSTTNFATAAQGALAETAVQPHTDGSLAMTATSNITLLAQDEIILVPTTGMSIYAGAGDDPTMTIEPDGVVIGSALISDQIESPTTMSLSAEDTISIDSDGLDASVWGNIKLEAADLSGPSSRLDMKPNSITLESLGGWKEARVVATNGTVAVEWKGGIGDSLHRHEFGTGITTNLNGLVIQNGLITGTYTD